MTARTPAGTPPPAARITILDILRALALLGIVIVHTHDHFNLYLPMPPAEGWQAAANSAADWAYEHLFVSKSFLLFSFLFGLSFFIQLDRREQQGIDFRKRFMWRLTLLFLLGNVIDILLVATFGEGKPIYHVTRVMNFEEWLQFSFNLVLRAGAECEVQWFTRHRSEL